MHAYHRDTLDHAYVQYIFGIYGQPASIETLTEEVSQEFLGVPIMATQYTPEVVREVQRLGSLAQDVSDYLNNKAEFQVLVDQTLGVQYATDREVVDQGEPYEKVMEIIGQRLQKSPNQVVVRVADARVMPGGGGGVAFVSSLEQAESFFKSTNRPHMIKALLESDLTLSSAVLIESYIDNFGSPSVTFFLADDGPILLHVNNQLLQDGVFVAGTNILTPIIEKRKNLLVEKGFKLATKVWNQGARGFMGFDTVLPKDTETQGLVKFIECNYRTTGTTIPAFNTLRATNFTVAPEDIGWVFVLSAAEYNTHLPDFSAVLGNLKQHKGLFEKTSNLDRVTAIPMYGMQDKDFDLVYFWPKEMLSLEQVESQINQLQRSLLSQKEIQLPTI